MHFFKKTPVSICSKNQTSKNFRTFLENNVNSAVSHSTTQSYATTWFSEHATLVTLVDLTKEFPVQKYMPVAICAYFFKKLFLGKSFLRTCRKFTGENPCRTPISINLLCTFIKIALKHRCSLANFLYMSKIHFSKNTSEGLLLKFGLIFSSVA